LKKNLAIIGLTAAVFWSAALHAGLWDWKSFTPLLQFRDLYHADSLVWCATEGGLLSFDSRTGSFTGRTNTDGLASNEMTAVTGDGSGNLWLGFSNGLLQKFQPSSGEWAVFDDFKGHPISRLCLRGDSLLVGMDIGLSLFLVSRQEVKETFRRLGSAFSVEVPVRDVLIHGGRIWAAVDRGLAHASVTNENLLDPASWTNVTFPVPSSEITCLAEWNGLLAAGCAAGVYVENGTGWNLLSNGYPNARLSRLADLGGALVAATALGCYRWDGLRWNPAAEGTGPSLSLAVDGRRLWMGTMNGLWEKPDSTSAPTHYTPNCPSGARFLGLAVDRDGILWCASDFYGGKGFSRFDGRSWRNFDGASNPEIGSNDFGCVAVDRRNRKWFGSWGNGALLMEGDSLFRQFKPPDFLSGSTSSDLSYAAVYDIEVEPSGTVWILNWNAVSGLPLVSVTRDSVWKYYSSPLGINNLRCIAVDGENRKWIGTDGNGVLILDDAGTPDNPDDDPEIQRITETDGLASNVITALAADQDGTMWIGTDDGLYYYSFGSLRQINVYYQDAITALMVDGVNNVWVGTNIGVGYFSTSTFASTHFTAAASPLVSDLITALAYDPKTGSVYIGTAKGLSRIETPFSKTVSELAGLTLYPNPFIPDRHGSLSVDGLAKNVSVCVYTMNGFLVRRFPFSGATGRVLAWDGKNDRGEGVAGGIYLVIARTEDGRQAVGKVAVVR
jgi:ligand-binding sensor domain-containing protein